MIKTAADIDQIRKEKYEDLKIRIDRNAVPTANGGRMHVMVCGRNGLHLFQLHENY